MGSLVRSSVSNFFYDGREYCDYRSFIGSRMYDKFASMDFADLESSFISRGDLLVMCEDLVEEIIVSYNDAVVDDLMLLEFVRRWCVKIEDYCADVGLRSIFGVIFRVSGVDNWDVVRLDSYLSQVRFILRVRIGSLRAWLSDYRSYCSLRVSLLN